MLTCRLQWGLDKSQYLGFRFGVPLWSKGSFSGIGGLDIAKSLKHLVLDVPHYSKASGDAEFFVN